MSWKCRLPNKPYLHEFLAGSSVAPPEGLPPKKKADPAYQARMDAIRAQLEEREYDRMTMDVRRQELTENERGEMVSFSSSLGEGVCAFV